jgi:hypothetical protein
MWFLVRAAFWLSIVIVVLPTPDSVKTPASNVGTPGPIGFGDDLRHAQFCAPARACEIRSRRCPFAHKAQAEREMALSFWRQARDADSRSRATGRKQRQPSSMGQIR